MSVLLKNDQELNVTQYMALAIPPRGHAGLITGHATCQQQSPQRVRILVKALSPDLIADAHPQSGLIKPALLQVDVRGACHSHLQITYGNHVPP